ncbi:hypothetical protein AB6A40_004976 [Gnathostoma spinigerum]|uniref:Uncharacterized protein n=1 Tax=Gnathostoma spinigerum TaxID=75299 RepID=A0ABD6EGA2_9BILA
MNRIIPSKGESHEIAAWKLLYWIQYLDHCSSRLREILRPDIVPDSLALATILPLQYGEAIVLVISSGYAA